MLLSGDNCAKTAGSANIYTKSGSLLPLIHGQQSALNTTNKGGTDVHRAVFKRLCQYKDNNSMSGVSEFNPVTAILC